MRYKYCSNCRPEIHTASKHTNGKKCRIADCKCKLFKLDEERIKEFNKSLYNLDGTPVYPELHEDGHNCYDVEPTFETVAKKFLKKDKI